MATTAGLEARGQVVDTAAALVEERLVPAVAVPTHHVDELRGGRGRAGPADEQLQVLGGGEPLDVEALPRVRVGQDRGHRVVPAHGGEPLAVRGAVAQPPAERARGEVTARGPGVDPDRREQGDLEALALGQTDAVE
ncbi:hypothetical protein, partial [Arthrobacter sp. 9V]|uniref:hypothetical protein n=1 Tax=Arthrobacter sp. 9V TaxID=2653132 RepID=UPI001356F29A